MRVANFCPLCGAPTEMRERYDRLRPVCTACDHTVFFEPKVAVVALVTDGEGRVLMVQRAFEPAKGSWVLPGGFIELEEPPAEAAVREVLEETGLQVRVNGLLDVLHRPDPQGLADIIIAYRAEVLSGMAVAHDDAAAVGWFARDALPEIGFRTTSILLERM